MNAKSTISSRALAVMIASMLSSTASVAVISNLGQTGQASTSLRDSGGALLPQGCSVRLVTFPGKASAEVTALAGSGLTSVMAAAVIFGTPSTVGTGTNAAGTIEFQSGAPLNAPLTGAHVLITNAGANELLLLRLSKEIPADDLAGPDGHITIHLDDTAVLYGQRNANGFSTAVTPAIVTPISFESWILSELGTTVPSTDLAPDADADRDGLVNLLEFAIGSKPGDGGSRGKMRLRRAASGTFFIQYLRRSAGSSVSYTPERLANEGAGPWVALVGSPSVPAVAPEPAPPAFEWVEQPLPSGASGFARLKVELVPP